MIKKSYALGIRNGKLEFVTELDSSKGIVGLIDDVNEMNIEVIELEMVPDGVYQYTVYDHESNSQIGIAEVNLDRDNAEFLFNKVQRWIDVKDTQALLKVIKGIGGTIRLNYEPYPLYWNEPDDLLKQKEKHIAQKVDNTPSIVHIFKDYDGDYKPEEMDWGNDVGLEKLY